MPLICHNTITVYWYKKIPDFVNTWIFFRRFNTGTKITKFGTLIKYWFEGWGFPTATYSSHDTAYVSVSVLYRR